MRPFDTVLQRRQAGRRAWILALLIPAAGLSCTSTRAPQETLSEYHWEIQNLKMRVGTSPEDAEALRDLGVIYLRTGHFREADAALSRGLVHDQLDPKLWFYQGLAQELLDSTEAALNTYQRFPYLSGSSIYSKAMRGRIAWLTEARTHRMLADALRRAATASPDSLSARTYAVLPLACRGPRAEYEALGKGLAERISRDLTQVRGLKIVQAATARAALAEAAPAGDPVDPAVYDRIGHALGAGLLIEGRCQVSSDRYLQVDLVIRDLRADSVHTITGEDRLENVLPLEENLFDLLLKQLGIWIPNRDRLFRVPASSEEAFLAYSQGLEQEDAGRLQEAADSYRKATALYPEFAPAVAREEAVTDKIIARASGKEDLLNLIYLLEASAATPYMMEARQQKLGGSIGSGFFPGQDTRRLPPGNIGELPAPPRPGKNR